MIKYILGKINDKVKINKLNNNLIITQIINKIKIRECKI